MKMKVSSWLGALLVGVASGCAVGSQLATPLDPPGRIVLGEASARMWGLAAGSSYTEVTHGDVPDAVKVGVTAWVEEHSYARDCIRYFDASRLFLVVATAYCYDPSRDVVMPDHPEVAAFDREGERHGEGIADYWDSIEIVPLWRTRQPL